MNLSYIEDYWRITRNREVLIDHYFPSDPKALSHQRSLWACDFFRQLPISSALEIGCTCGRNLFHLQCLNPEIKVTGIDINPDVVEFARSKVKGQLVLGNFFDLEKFFSQKFDLIFTMGILVTIPPKNLEKLMEKILSLSHKYIIHFEYQGDGRLMSGREEDKPVWRVSDSYWWANDIVSFYEKRNIFFQRFPIPQNVIDVGLNEVIFVDLTGSNKKLLLAADEKSNE
ncbi:MAG: class I SAM-dependent methyltransferase [Candidatus Omnitrophica bacterium]|nr:class I SAM-dependent methyltransferase [Candidatus Omnitrophota bacterium]